MNKVNAHLHTPYSFSAFESIPQALNMAVAEGVQVVGINDFYTFAGFEEWKRECTARNLVPLYNAEFIALDEEMQQNGIRVNDPNNPGRTYISGKGLTFPVKLDEPYASQLASVVSETNMQVAAMCAKLNELLMQKQAGFTLDIEKIEKELTMGSVRERHLAKALRIEAAKQFDNDATRIKDLLESLYGKEMKAQEDDLAAIENEIRGNLLKAGGAAFVAETPAAFLPIETIRKLILNAQGIPTYPFLADDAKGGYTDFEAPLDKTMARLKELGFCSVEFITTRNGADLLEQYVTQLWDAGFVVTLGSEHNTPVMEPIELFARHSAPLSERVKQINYRGACIVAAHQARVANGLNGYVDAEGKADIALRQTFITEGDSIIKKTII